MGDPMVPLASVEHVLGSLGSNFRVEIAERGGHVGFPSNFSLGQNAPAGLEAQALAWLRSH
jgi:predicted alpha/beta-fold hydrolase